jgi:hypothetical protein
VLRARSYETKVGSGTAPLYYHMRTGGRVVSKYPILWRKGIIVGNLRLDIHKRGSKTMYRSIILCNIYWGVWDFKKCGNISYMGMIGHHGSGVHDIPISDKR